MKRILLTMAIVLCIIAPASAIIYCFDYVMYKVGGQDSNGLGYNQLIDNITEAPYNYQRIDTFKATDSMKRAYWLSAMQKGDIIFLGTDHVGYATGPFTASGHNIDHYLQIKGQSGVRRPVSEIEQYALHDDLDYFINSHSGNLPDTMSIYRSYQKGAKLVQKDLQAIESIPMDVVFLEKGRPYFVVGEGTCSLWDNPPEPDGVDSCFVYAKWRIGDMPQIWGQLELVDPSIHLSELIEKNTGKTAEYKDTHIYEAVVIGEGKTLKARVYDGGGYSDNHGKLTISVYEAIPNDVIPNETIV